MIEKIENLSEFNQSALSIFTIARISLVDEWSKKDYVEPNNEVKELLSICGIATQPINLNINRLLGQSYLKQIDYEFKTADESLIFKDGIFISSFFSYLI